MKIIFVLGELGMGGAERQVIMLARGLAALEQDVTLVLFRPAGPLLEEARVAGVRIHALGRGNPFAMMLHLRRFIAQQAPDVVHGYLTAGNVGSLVALFLRRRPLLVWGIRASNMDMARYSAKWRFVAMLERILARLPDLLIVNSQAGKNHLAARGIGGAKIAVIENGIDLDRLVRVDGDRESVRAEWGIEPEHLVIGHVGRIDPMKDHATFLAALSLLTTRRNDWSAVIVAVGDEAARNELRAEAAKRGLNNVRVVGPSHAMGRIYSGFDLLCSSSAFGEGFSNVIAEALAAGLPVVATDVGDAGPLIADAGMVVPPSDPAKLADAIHTVIERREEASGQARAQIAGFSVERLAARTLALLEARGGEQR